MFSRKLIYVAVYVFTLLADIKVTTSSKATPHYGYVNGQQASVCHPTPTIVHYPTGSPQNWQGNCDPRATNQPYSHISPATTTHGAFLNDPIKRGFYNNPNSGLHNDPHRIFPNRHAQTPYSTGTDPTRHHPVIGYPGYLVYQNSPKNSQNPASGCSGAGDPQWDPEDPEWEPEDPGWDPEDPGLDPEDPGWDPEGDPNDPDDSDFSFTDMFSRMAQQVMSLGQNPAMGQLGNFLTNNNPLSGIAADPNAIPNPNVGTFASTAGNTVPQLPGISADPGVTSFANTAGIPQGVGADPGITDFLAPQNSIIPSNPGSTGSSTGTNAGITDFLAPQNSISPSNPGSTASTTGTNAGITDSLAPQNSMIPSNPGSTGSATGTDAGITDFLAPPNNIIPFNSGITGSADANPATDVEDFAVDQGNVLSTQQGEESTQLLANPSSTRDSEQDIGQFDAIEGNTLSQSSASEDGLTLDSPNTIASQEGDCRPYDPTESDFGFILFVDNDDQLDERNFDVTSGNIITPFLEIENKAQDSKSDPSQFTSFGDSDKGDTTQLLRFISPLTTNGLSHNNAGFCQRNSIRQHVNLSGDSKNNQKSNPRVPLQLLFKSNMSQGGVKIPSNLAKNSNCIKPHVSTSRDASICKEIRESAKIFNRTQNINLNPFLVLTPKNLTRSSLSETNIETYITSEEMEALYEDAVSTDQSVKVLFLPDIELSEEQIQNIVERISLDISKEEGRNCKELMLIPLDLLKNRVETPSSEIPATTVVEDSACQNNWSLPWHSDSGETNYQQEPSENTFSSSSSDFETTAGVTNLTTSTSQQTCQTLTTETDFSDPILPNDIPVYPETTTPCPTLSTDNFSFSNFSSSGASAVNESSVKDDQNQELAKEEQNCSTQLKNETHHQTEIFIPCFIKIGHENNSLEKKICEMQQNGCITKFLSHQYLFNSQDDHIKINSGGTISSNSECLQPLPPCSKGEMVDPISSGSPYQTSASATVEPVNNWLSGSSKIDSSQSICDSVHFKEEEKPVSDKKKSEITTYPHQNNSGSSPSPQYCAAEQTSDVTQSSSSFNVITYPITIDSEVKPILQPCTTEEGAWNSGSYGKYGVAREKNVIDQFETVNSNRDVTRISNEYCHCERTNAIKTSLNTQQTEYPVTNIHSLDLIKKNAKDNYHIVVGKDYISHPEKGITILDSIKKNAKINDFTAISGERSGLTGESKLTCSSNIGSLTQNTQEYDINSSLERKKVDPCSSSDGSKESENEDSRQSSDNKLSSSYNIVTTPGNQICNLTKKQDEAKSIPEIKPEVPKCPTSRVFIVKIDNIKPNNGSCPCSSFNSLVDTVCSHENLKNTYSKDHNCLCKLLSRNRQRIGQPEDTQPELNLNETCASSAYPPTPQDISGYDVIPKDECRNSDESIPPLEITQTSPVSNTYHSTKNSTECDKNITTNTEIHTSYKSPMNEYCLPCNLGNFIELQRNVSQKIEEYAQKTCINNIPLSPVCQGKEVPIVYPPSDKITIETPIKEPVIQTFTEAHKIPVPEICPPTEKPIYKPAVQNPSTLHSIENTTRNLQIRHKVPSLDICPPTSGYSEMSGIPFNKPTAEKPPMPKPVLNTRNLQAPQKIPSTYICPPTVEYKKTSGIPVPVIKPTAQTVPTPPRSSYICPPSQEHGKTNLEPAIIQTHPTHHKITKPATNEYTKKTEIPVSKSTAETISTQQDICVPIPKDCPPSYSHKTNEIPFVKSNTQDLSTPQKIDTCHPPTDEYKKTSEIPIIKPTAQTVPKTQRIPHVCPPLQGHGKTTLTPTIQTLPMDCEIPKTQIHHTTDDHTKKTEIPVFKSTTQTIPTQEICVPMDCPSTSHNKTNGIPFVKPTPQKTPVPNTCPSNDEPVNTDKIELKPIAQTQDWGRNIVENQTKVENKNQDIEIPKVSLNENCLCKLKAILERQRLSSGQTGRNVDEIKQKPYGITNFPTPQHDPILTNCVPTDEQPKTNEINSQSTSNFPNSQCYPVQTNYCVPAVEQPKTNEINSQSAIDFPNSQRYPVQTNCVPADKKPKTNEINSQSTIDFPNSQRHPVQTNCVPTDEQPITNEVIPQSVSQTKDWNIANNHNTQVNDGSCRGDMKPTTEMDCEECRKRRKELLAKILKEVFVNNVDLFYEDKNPCKPCSGQI